MLDQTMHVTLPTLHVGAPTAVGPLTLFPIWTDAPVPDVPVPLDPPATATIGELDSGPAVELLTAKNPTPLPYVLLEGTIVDGGWQHRVLVHSVLVGGSAQLDLPVRCVEQGRWNGDTAQRLHRRRARSVCVGRPTASGAPTTTAPPTAGSTRAGWPATPTRTPRWPRSGRGMAARRSSVTSAWSRTSTSEDVGDAP